MKHTFFWLVIGMMLGLSGCALPRAPGTLLSVAPELSVSIEIPNEKWIIASVAPDFLIEEMAEHIIHDLEAQGKVADLKSIEMAVKKQLAANEHFIFNPVSRSHMEIDFSPLEPGESTPSRHVVALSARYAAESLESEEGIGELSYEVDKVRIYGADYAYRLQARFMKHDVPTRFCGLIGFVDTSWFYIYYMDSGRDNDDYPQAVEILHSMQVVRGER